MNIPARASELKALYESSPKQATADQIWTELAEIVKQASDDNDWKAICELCSRLMTDCRHASMLAMKPLAACFPYLKRIQNKHL